jgi:hemoglobin-like flavoprotein
MPDDTTLTAADIAVIRSTFDRVWSRSSAMTDAFYGRLFDRAPEVKPLFRGDMDVLKRDFIGTLAVLVGSLDDTTGLVTILDNLARNHRRYGVEESHYPLVGGCLLEALAEGLGPYWTPEAEQAWRKLYTVIAGRMIEAAYG